MIFPDNFYNRRGYGKSQGINPDGRDSAKGQGRRDGGGRREEGGWEWGKGESGEGLEAEGVEVFL